MTPRLLAIVEPGVGGDLWTIAPQAGIATVLLTAFAYAMRNNRADRSQYAKQLASIHARHDAELRARDKQIERLRRDLDRERVARREAEEREHALRMGGAS